MSVEQHTSVDDDACETAGGAFALANGAKPLVVGKDGVAAAVAAAETGTTFGDCRCDEAVPLLALATGGSGSSSSAMTFRFFWATLHTQR